MYLILLAGMPATGKTTLANAIAARLGLPVIEKDGLKEVLFDTVGFTCYAEKRRLDHAANGLLLSLAETFITARRPVILVNNFDTPAAQKLTELVQAAGCPCVTIFRDGDPALLYRRYVERDAAHARHLGHILQEHYPPLPGDSLDYTMTRQEFHDKFVARGMRDVVLPGTRIDLDAAHMPDPAALVDRIKTLI